MNINKNILYQDGKYYKELDKDVLLLDAIKDYFGGWVKLSELLNIGYSTFHSYYMYKGLSYKHALLISYYSDNKFNAFDILYLCYNPKKEGSKEHKKNKYRNVKTQIEK